MTMYSIPDLTGADPVYSVSTDIYTIFTNPMKIVFNIPVYLDSLIITVGGVILTRGTDWTVAEEDYTTMSKMKNISINFSSILIRSVNIISSRARPYQISCSYQQIFRNNQNVNAMSGLAPKLLPIDSNKTNTDNVITESQVINTFNNQNLIIPSCGAFFADSVIVRLPTTPLTTLVNGTDYIVVGCDVQKTRTTNVTAGVYTAILLTRPYAGRVNVTYHAYGGVVTLADLTAMYQTINNVISFLTTNTFLSPESLGTNPVILSILTQLATINLSLLGGSGGTISDSAMTTYILGLLSNFMQTAPTSPATLTSNTPWNDGGNLAFVVD